MTLLETDATAVAYGTLAPYYDALTGGYEHDRWLGRLERLARAHGLAGRRVLDVGCGTGKSLLPLLARGYEGTGCDICPEMLAVAGETLGDGVELVQADMRDLPDLGEFDLVTCLDDAINYLLGEDDLHRAVRSLAGALAPAGLLLFDTNTLLTHRETFSCAWVAEQPGVFLCWNGHGTDEGAAGERGEASVEIFSRGEDGRWTRAQSRHVQRHWGPEEILDALDAAGLESLAVVGQHVGARFEDHADELVHNKAVHVARRPA
jgi:SAM-dependent methyltransferase